VRVGEGLGRKVTLGATVFDDPATPAMRLGVGEGSPLLVAGVDVDSGVMVGSGVAVGVGVPVTVGCGVWVVVGGRVRVGVGVGVSVGRS
jgi:hypothetical protein